ncbi:MAG: glycosyltransferase family 4 protein [Pyrinomonadaceae bacterium]|nr:glycosyltransferase family 4 protein [Pyrinomonadaceae bacterium]
MKPIKVLHVLEVEKEAFYFNNLADFTDRNEVEFAFATFAPEGGFTESLRRRGFNVYSLDAMGKKRFVKAARALRQILKKENPDIVHTHLFNPTFIGLMLAKWQNRKTVLTRHHSDALHLLPTRLKRNFYLKLENINNRKADHIIAPSRMVRECIVDWEKTPDEKVSLIPYGQTNERFDAITPELIEKKRAELGMNDQLSLVCVSRLFNRKGHIYLFRALAPLIKKGLSVKLYLVGTGDYKENLETAARELGILANIEFLGWRDDGLAIIGAADIIVHPSLEDALSQSLIESLMLQRPIVATDISGAGDTLDGGKYGKLVPPEDSESFQKALEEIIENLDAARENAKKGRKYLLEYMNAQRVADEYVKIYRKVLGL